VRLLARRAACLLLILVSALILIELAAPLLHLSFQPDGDMAADMLLVNQMHDTGYLLTGHYSRFGFNHPGPIFLYANAAFEQLGGLVNLPRGNAWILSSVTVNFLFLLLSAWCLARLFDRRLSLTVVAAVLPMAALVGENLVSSWMPYRLILPFAAFYLASLLAMNKGLRYLPLAMTLACILIHGYVTLPAFVLPVMLLISALQLHKNGWRDPVQWRWIWLALGIGLLFFLPLLIDTLIQYPANGNVMRIIKAQRSLRGTQKASLQEVLEFTKSFWGILSTGLVPALLAGLVALARSDSSQRSVLSQASLLALLLCMIFILYHLTAPKPLYPFIALYYLGVPLALISLLTYFTLQTISNSALRACLALVIAAGVLFWLPHQKVPTPAQRDDIRQLGDYLLSEQHGQIVLDYPTQAENAWAHVTGLLVYLKDHKAQACVAHPEMRFLFSPGATCAAGTPVTAYLTHSTECDDHCLVSAGEYALSRPPLSANGDKSKFNGCSLAKAPWTQTGTDCAVVTRTVGAATFGPFVVLPPGRYRFEIDYASSLSTDASAGFWDVVFNKAKGTLEKGDLPGSNSQRTMLSGEFFSSSQQQVEIRTFLSGPGELKVYGITITRL
jgi:MFS family permease